MFEEKFAKLAAHMMRKGDTGGEAALLTDEFNFDTHDPKYAFITFSCGIG
jgi:hypothetical protein